jgi:hypothetical protein
MLLYQGQEGRHCRNAAPASFFEGSEMLPRLHTRCHKFTVTGSWLRQSRAVVLLREMRRIVVDGLQIGALE